MTMEYMASLDIQGIQVTTVMEHMDFLRLTHTMGRYTTVISVEFILIIIVSISVLNSYGEFAPLQL